MQQFRIEQVSLKTVCSKYCFRINLDPILVAGVINLPDCPPEIGYERCSLNRRNRRRLFKIRKGTGFEAAIVNSSSGSDSGSGVVFGLDELGIRGNGNEVEKEVQRIDASSKYHGIYHDNQDREHGIYHANRAQFQSTARRRKLSDVSVLTIDKIVHDLQFRTDIPPGTK